MVQSFFLEWYCYLRKVEDLSAGGKTPHEGPVGEPSVSQQFLFASMVECQPISAKDHARLHQFGEKVLLGICIGLDRQEHQYRQNSELIPKPIS